MTPIKEHGADEALTGFTGVEAPGALPPDLDRRHARRLERSVRRPIWYNTRKTRNERISNE
jgi:hypothetical protein